MSSRQHRIQRLQILQAQKEERLAQLQPKVEEVKKIEEPVKKEEVVTKSKKTKKND